MTCIELEVIDTNNIIMRSLWYKSNIDVRICSRNTLIEICINLYHINFRIIIYFGIRNINWNWDLQLNLYSITVSILSKANRKWLNQYAADLQISTLKFRWFMQIKITSYLKGAVLWKKCNLHFSIFSCIFLLQKR